MLIIILRAFKRYGWCFVFANKDKHNIEHEQILNDVYDSNYG